ncbi:MAG TPA: hypothetical protein VI408_10355 [Gaiellaceae bacterium]
MGHLLLLAFLGGLFVLVLVLALSLLSGWRAHDAREIVVNHAFHEFIEEGEKIPGAAPGWLARALIAVFAAADDPRRGLIPDERPVFAHKPVRVYRETRDPDENVWQ